MGVFPDGTEQPTDVTGRELFHTDTRHGYQGGRYTTLVARQTTQGKKRRVQPWVRALWQESAKRKQFAICAQPSCAQRARGSLSPPSAASTPGELAVAADSLNIVNTMCQTNKATTAQPWRSGRQLFMLRACRKWIAKSLSRVVRCRRLGRQHRRLHANCRAGKERHKPILTSNSINKFNLPTARRPQGRNINCGGTVATGCHAWVGCFLLGIYSRKEASGGAASHQVPKKENSTCGRGFLAGMAITVSHTTRKRN